MTPGEALSRSEAGHCVLGASQGAGARQAVPAVPTLRWRCVVRYERSYRRGCAPASSTRDRVPCHGRAVGRETGGEEDEAECPPSQLGRGVGMARPGTAWSSWSPPPPGVTPAGAWGLQPPPPPSGRETPSQQKQESPSRTLSEQGAGREINSGVSGCPGPGGGEKGKGPPCAPPVPPL